jgi:general secretion pathway protein A
MTDYTQFYGFSENPFDLSPDSKFFFSAESHREALAALSYGITQRRGFVLILGESGIGKTMLINQIITMYRLCQTPYFGLIGKAALNNRVLDTLGANVKIVYFPQSEIAFDQMLKEILFTLNLPLRESTKGTMLHELYHYLIGALERDENIVIIIDEAHNISLEAIEELRLLSNLETSKSKLLQIVIVGQPELKTKLRSEVIRQINQRIVVSAQIGPITAEESMKYIDYRLKVVGSSSSEVFTDEALSLICRHAKGIPRTINILCNNALSVGYGLSEKQISPSTVRKVRRVKDILTPEKVQKLTSGMKRNLPRKISFSLLLLVVLASVIYISKDYVRHMVNIQTLEHFMEQLSLKAKSDPSIPEVKRHTTPEAKPDTPNTDILQTSPITPQTSASLPPSSSQAKTEITIKKVVEAKTGMNLSSLTLKYYSETNTTLMDYILEFNPEITNPDLILIDQKIKIPEITESSLITKSSDGMFNVHLGTFSYAKEAARFIDDSGLKGKNVEVVPRKVSRKETWYRVSAGPFVNRDEGLKVLEEMKEKGLLPSFRQRAKKE